MIPNIVKGMGRWKRALRGESADKPAPREAQLPPAPSKRAPSSDHGTAGRDAPGALAELSGLSEKTLSRQVVALIETYKGQDGDADALEILHRLTQDQSTIIRQPPSAAQQLLSICQEPGARIGELTSLIERDPAMAQALLRHANSAWYSTPGSAPIVAIGPAVQRIGLSGVFGSVVSRVVSAELSRPGPPYNDLAKEIWYHMIRVGPLARSLAPSFGAATDEAFTAGLLHDVGKLVVFDVLSELRRKLRRAVTTPDGFVEQVLAALHEPLGALAAIRWGLTPGYVGAILQHHRKPAPTTPNPLGEAIYVANRVDHAVTDGEPVDFAVIWADGALTGDLGAASRIWASTAPEALEVSA